MILRSTVLASALILAAAAPAAADSPYNGIYSFGDSLSDAGNVFISTGGYEPAFPYSDGRFTNGNVWNQVLANSLGLGPLAAYLAGGTDYAFGYATTGNPDTNNAQVPNLGLQVGQFLINVDNKASPTALYTFSIGANDLFNILDSGVTGTTALTEAANAAAAEAAAASALQKAGASHLVIFDVPDLGLTPGVLADGSAASQAATQLSAYYDSQLFHDLLPVEAAGLRIYDLNTFALIDNVVANPAAYGFTTVNAPCYVAPNPLSPYAGGGTPCSNPDSYLFWDALHPTAAAQFIIGRDAAIAAAPEPSTWAMMLTGFAALGFAGWRRGREQAAAAV